MEDPRGEDYEQENHPGADCQGLAQARPDTFDDTLDRLGGIVPHQAPNVIISTNAASRVTLRHTPGIIFSNQTPYIIALKMRLKALTIKIKRGASERIA